MSFPPLSPTSTAKLTELQRKATHAIRRNHFEHHLSFEQATLLQSFIDATGENLQQYQSATKTKEISAILAKSSAPPHSPLVPASSLLRRASATFNRPADSVRLPLERLTLIPPPAKLQKGGSAPQLDSKSGEALEKTREAGKILKPNHPTSPPPRPSTLLKPALSSSLHRLSALYDSEEDLAPIPPELLPAPPPIPIPKQGGAPILCISDDLDFSDTQVRGRWLLPPTPICASQDGRSDSKESSVESTPGNTPPTAPSHTKLRRASAYLPSGMKALKGMRRASASQAATPSSAPVSPWRDSPKESSSRHVSRKSFEGSETKQEWFSEISTPSTRTCMEEMPHFRKTVELAMRVYYLYPNTTKKMFSKEEVKWIRQLIEIFIRKILNSAILDTATWSAFGHIIAKKQRQFQEFIDKIHGPKSYLSEASPQFTPPDWIAEPPFTTAQDRYEWSKYLADFKYSYPAIYQTEFTAKEKACFEVFLQTYALETFYRFPENSYERAFARVIHYHPKISPTTVHSLIRKFYIEKAKYADDRQPIEKPLGSLEQLHSQARNCPFFSSEALFDLLLESLEAEKQKDLRVEVAEFHSMVQEIDMLRKTGTNFKTARDQMLKPDNLQRYFQMGNELANLQMFCSLLNAFSPRILTKYSIMKSSTWLNPAIEGAKRLPTVVIADSAEERLIQRLQMHDEATPWEDAIYLLFSNIALRKDFESENDFANGELATALIRRLVEN